VTGPKHDLEAMIAATFERLRANLLQSTADPERLKRALDTLADLRSKVDRDPAWVRRILQQIEESTPES
jgi:hypothetical protein